MNAPFGIFTQEEQDYLEYLFRNFNITSLDGEGDQFYFKTQEELNRFFVPTDPVEKNQERYAELADKLQPISERFKYRWTVNLFWMDNEVGAEFKIHRP